MKKCSRIIRLEKLTQWNLKHTWSKWLHQDLRSHPGVFESKKNENPSRICAMRTFVFSTLVEFFQGERHFSSSEHPYGYWNQYEVGIIVTYGNLGIFRCCMTLNKSMGSGFRLLGLNLSSTISCVASRTDFTRREKDQPELWQIAEIRSLLWTSTSFPSTLTEHEKPTPREVILRLHSMGHLHPVPHVYLTNVKTESWTPCTKMCWRAIQ
ncbi:uncharacterized protein [Pseudorca crassidens]|uniref:uncharacterized protein n=1 Tax=Pseudorca crassidens TaxID=82174 RepID=UPI00352C917E